MHIERQYDHNAQLLQEPLICVLPPPNTHTQHTLESPIQVVIFILCIFLYVSNIL